MANWGSHTLSIGKLKKRNEHGDVYYMQELQSLIRNLKFSGNHDDAPFVMLSIKANDPVVVIDGCGKYGCTSDVELDDTIEGLVVISDVVDAYDFTHSRIITINGERVYAKEFEPEDPEVFFVFDRFVGRNEQERDFFEAFYRSEDEAIAKAKAEGTEVRNICKDIVFEAETAA